MTITYGAGEDVFQAVLNSAGVYSTLPNPGTELGNLCDTAGLFMIIRPRSRTIQIG